MARVQKQGFTLIELMVVIAIMGILSAAGIAGLHGAVENSRVEDAAKNVTAFLERTANESTRLSATLCLSVSSNNRRLFVYKASDCNNLPSGSASLYSMELDLPMTFTNSCPNLGCTNDGCDKNWLSGTNGVFTPKLGLSAAPASGHVCMQYAKTDHYAVAVKSNKKNFIEAVTCRGTDCE